VSSLLPHGDAHADEAFFRLIVENAVDVIVRANAARERIYISPSSREVLGYEPAELLGRIGFELVHPDDRPDVDQVFAVFGPRNPCMGCTFRMRRKDGSYVWIGARYRYLPEDGGLLAVLRDISAQKEAEAMVAEANAKLEVANRALHALAHQDGLTGLANRRHFDQQLQTELRRVRREQRPLGVILIDVDHFKGYNDRYGHLAGDTCLRRISQTLLDTLRRPCDQVARYGGEEFVALLPGVDLDGTLQVAQQIRLAVAGLAIEHLGSSHGIVTVSAGASAVLPPGGPESAIELLTSADGALYRAKTEGRNRVSGARATTGRVRII
jgi:diguanylate cyclase (GGDEF)-like protein/PAS domain S-box-containing protein